MSSGDDETDHGEGRVSSLPPKSDPAYALGALVDRSFRPEDDENAEDDDGAAPLELIRNRSSRPPGIPRRTRGVKVPAPRPKLATQRDDEAAPMPPARDRISTKPFDFPEPRARQESTPPVPAARRSRKALPSRPRLPSRSRLPSTPVPQVPAAPSAVDKPRAPLRSEPVGKPRAPLRSEPVGKPRAPLRSEPVGKPRAPLRSEPVGKPRAPLRSEPVGKPRAPLRSEPVGKPRAPLRSEPVGKPRAPLRSEPADAPEPVDASEAAPAVKRDDAARKGSSSEPERQVRSADRESDPIGVSAMAAEESAREAPAAEPKARDETSIGARGTPVSSPSQGSPPAVISPPPSRNWVRDVGMVAAGIAIALLAERLVLHPSVDGPPAAAEPIARVEPSATAPSDPSPRRDRPSPAPTASAAARAVPGDTAPRGGRAPVNWPAVSDAAPAESEPTSEEEAAPSEPASDAAPTADPASEAPPFNRDAARSALASAVGAASGCGKGEGTGVVQVSVTFANSGRVTAANVSGAYAGTPTGGCVARAMRTATVPPYSGTTVTVFKRITIP